jgi:hypothetical protein
LKKGKFDGEKYEKIYFMEENKRMKQKVPVEAMEFLCLLLSVEEKVPSLKIMQIVYSRKTRERKLSYPSSFYYF